MAARRLKEELLNLALAEIDPPEQKNEACCKSISEALRLVDMVRVLDEAPALDFPPILARLIPRLGSPHTTARSWRPRAQSSAP
jgi:hypothetical protein